MPLSFASNIGVRHETLGADTTNSRGTQVTSGSIGAKGAFTNIGSTTSFDYEGITIFYGRCGSATNGIFDVAISSGGSSYIIAQDIRMEFSRTAGGATAKIFLPLHVPSGSQITIRTQTGIAGSIVTDFVIIGHSRNVSGGPGYARCTVLSTATISRGVSFEPGGTANTKGTVTVLTSNARAACDAIFLMIGSDADSAKTLNIGWLIDVGWGTATSAAPWYIQNFPMMSETTLDFPVPIVHQIWPAAIAIGDSIQIRCQSTSTATADNKLDAMVYGLKR